MKQILFCLFFALAGSVFGQNNPKDEASKKAFSDAISNLKDRFPSKGATRDRAEAAVYAGHVFDNPDVKNYDKALDALENAGTAGDENAGKMLFRIYFAGGYGTEPQPEKARTVLAGLPEDYRRGLADIFRLRDKLNSGTTADKIKYINLLLNFELSVPIAEYWTGQIAAAAPTEADFFRKKIKKLTDIRTGMLGPAEPAYLAFLREISEGGSAAAALEWAEKNGAAGSRKMSASEAYKLLMPVVDSKADYIDADMRLKALTALENVQSGKAKLISLRKINTFAGAYPELKSSVKSYTDEFAEAEKDLSSLEGFARLVKKYQMLSVQLDENDPRTNFHDNYGRILALNTEFSSGETLELIGEKNLKNYQKTFRESLLTIIKNFRRPDDLAHLYTDLLRPSAEGLMNDGAGDEFRKAIHIQLLNAFSEAGSADQITKDFKALTEEKSLREIIESRPAAYFDAITRQLTRTYDELTNPTDLLRVQQAIIRDPYKRALFPDHKKYFAKRFKDLKITPADSLLAVVRSELEYKHFKNLEEGKTFRDYLEAANLPAGSDKDVLFHEFKEKCVREVFGDSHSLEKVEELENALKTNNWLKPESDAFMTKYLHDAILYDIEHTKIHDVESGMHLYSQIASHRELGGEALDMLRTLRAKIVNDIYGLEPSAQKIAEMGELVKTERRLQPEGLTIYYGHLALQRAKELASKTYTSFAQAQADAEISGNMPGLPAEAKMQMYAVIQEKAMADIFGENPTLDQLNEIDELYRTHEWLDAAHSDVRFNYLNNSKYSFSGLIYDRDSVKAYRYEMKRKSEEPIYELEVFSMKPEISKIYFTDVLITEGKEAIQADFIYNMKVNSYSRRKIVSNYFRATYPAKGDYIEGKVEGKFMLQTQEDNTHGFNMNYLKKKEEAGAFTSKAALRTALKYFILSYPSLFDQ